VDSEKRFVPTGGVPGLDYVLHRGFLREGFYLVQGDPGSGKTTVAIQYARCWMEAKKSCLYITLTESRRDLSSACRSHGWSLDGIERRHRSLRPNEVRGHPSSGRRTGWGARVLGLPPLRDRAGRDDQGDLCRGGEGCSPNMSYSTAYPKCDDSDELLVALGPPLFAASLLTTLFFMDGLLHFTFGLRTYSANGLILSEYVLARAATPVCFGPRICNA
jgi:hypothetical protein